MCAKILLVEDYADSAELYIMQLKDAGHTVKLAENGAQAIYLACQPFDLVLLDLGLPDIDGALVGAHIRAINPRLPIIIISAEMPSRINQVAVALGAASVLRKPFEGSKLRAIINQILSKTKKNSCNVF